MAVPKFKVAICGGGVGGLVFAVALSRYKDIEFEVYEAATEFSPIGAGIGIWPRVWNALRGIGLEGLAEFASSPPSKNRVCTLVLRKSDQQDGFPFCEIMTDGTLLFFHRVDFHGELVKHLPPSCHIQYSKRLKSYSRLETGRLELLFGDGSTTTCDLLVGADGIKSAIRGEFLREQAKKASADNRPDQAREFLSAVDPVWSGTVAYRALVPVENVKDYTIHDYGTQYLGKNMAIITYPIAKGKFVNIVAYHTDFSLAETPFVGSWIEDADKDNLLDTLSHWEPEILRLLQGMNKPTRWAIHKVKDLSLFATDGVALIGDAAHAMEPHLGSGAGQAIEDACVLAELLGHHLASLKTLPDVLRIYDALRRPFAIDIVHRSFENGRYLSMNHEDFILDGCNAVEQKQRLKEMGNVIVENWKWAWETSLSDMVCEGFTLLEMAYNLGEK